MLFRGFFRRSEVRTACTVVLLIFLIINGCGGSHPSPSSNLASEDAKGTAGTVSCKLPLHPVMRHNGPFLPVDMSKIVGVRQRKLRKLRGHIAEAARTFSDLGKESEDLEIPITIALNLNNEADLDRELKAIYDPRNSKFRRYLSAKEFRDRYSPTEDQVATVKTFLESGDVTPGTVNTSRTLVHARGSLRALNALFYTEVHQLKGAGQQVYFSPKFELQIPSELPIQGVHGLQNITTLMPFNKPLKSGLVKATGTGPSGGMSPADIRKAYRIPASHQGEGQVLALFQLDGYTLSDITGYVKQFGLPAVPLRNILVGRATGRPGSGAAEVTLDIQLMIAMAPKAKQILVYEGPNSEQGVLDTYSRIANDNLAHVVSTSWGINEERTTNSFLQSENAIFKQMAAQGQTIFSASGDTGAYDNGVSLTVTDPSSQPFATAVGGTHLTTASDGSYQQETTWIEGEDRGDRGGGGGVSSSWPIPDWQRGLATEKTLGSNSMRNTPDVALNSDPKTGYSIYFNGQWKIFGGTSCAAPIWAGFTALVNEQREKNNLQPLGFGNSAIYRVGRSTRYFADFFDIADNSTNGFYPAVSGYDNATGWGSFNGEGLLNDLSGDSPNNSNDPQEPDPSSCQT